MRKTEAGTGILPNGKLRLKWRIQPWKEIFSDRRRKGSALSRKEIGGRIGKIYRSMCMDDMNIQYAICADPTE